MPIYKSYLAYCKDYTKIQHNICVSKCTELSLVEYCYIAHEYCMQFHDQQKCTHCQVMIKAGNIVIAHGLVLLSQVFKACFPDVTYTSTKAKHRLLQLPLVAVTIGISSSGKAEVYLLEALKGLDYAKLTEFMESKMCSKNRSHFTKEDMKHLLTLAQSNREREVMRHIICQTSQLSATAACKLYGWQNMTERFATVENYFKEVSDIREAIENIASTQESAVLLSLGIQGELSCSSEDEDDKNDDHDSSFSNLKPLPTTSELDKLLVGSDFNWYEFITQILESCKCDGEDKEETIITNLEEYFAQAVSSFSEHQKLLNESHSAFWNELNTIRPLWKHKAAEINGEIVSDSDCTDNEKYIEIDDIRSVKARSLIIKRRKSIQRRTRYLKAKMIAEKNFLARKQSQKVRGILKDYPDIGEVIENYVKERNIGADAWRRTGVLTFDGNTKVKSKVTFNRIREHLQRVYQRSFSYGTVVQLCVARNKRRKSAVRYKGVAHVTCRRARKGFQLKYNPDSHWSNALYRGLNLLQYRDGRHILNINRDDAAGFRLDTMATHRLHRTPIVQGQESITTYTDYVNRYPSTLQSTSYNFSGTQTTQEVCVGVVKASGLFPKNAAQHAADLAFLQTLPHLSPVFNDPVNNSPKVIECVRVDGGNDEGPNHEEIQFFWTARHIETPTVSTLVTTRNSGASYLNRVELQNGCMALGHANLFIPSTLAGSCLDAKSKKLILSNLKTT